MLTCPLVRASVVALGALGRLALAAHGQLGGDLLLHAALLVGLVGGADQLQGHHHHGLGAHAVLPRGDQRGHLPPSPPPPTTPTLPTTAAAAAAVAVVGEVRCSKGKKTKGEGFMCVCVCVCGCGWRGGLGGLG